MHTKTKTKLGTSVISGALCLALAGLAQAQGANASAAPDMNTQTDSVWDRVTPGLQIIALAQNNVSLGSRQGRWGTAGGAFLSFDVDLEKDRRDKGAQFHFMHSFFPFMHSAGIDAASKWSGSVGAYHPGAAQHNDAVWGYLSRFTLSNTFLDERLYVEAGRFNARHVFATAGTCDTLMLTCTEPMHDGATGTPPPPYGSWGLYGRYHTSDSHYVHAGAFESNGAHYVAKKTGWDWRTRDASGVSMLAGFGNRTDYADTPWAGSYEADLSYFTSLQTDPVSTRVTRGNTSVLLRGRQAVWRADGGRAGVENPEAVELFGAFSYSFYSANPFRSNTELGVTWRGFWRSRPTDNVNLRLNWLRLSGNQQEFQRLARVTEGGADIATRANSLRVALDAQFEMTKHSFVEVSAQYTHNPDSFHNPFIPQRLSGGAVLGVQFFWNIGGELGW